VEFGTTFGRDVTKLFEDGVEIGAGHRHPKEALNKTAENFGVEAPALFEAVFVHHDLPIDSFGELAARLLGITDKNAVGRTGLWAMITIGAIIVAFAADAVLYRGVELPSHQLARRSW
jgi:hypothetical protein